MTKLNPFFGTGYGIFDMGSGMGKNQDPGSRINIPDPQHCFTVFRKINCWRIYTCCLDSVDGQCSKSEPDNYRPVSFTSLCGKLMECWKKREMTKQLTYQHPAWLYWWEVMPDKSAGVHGDGHQGCRQGAVPGHSVSWLAKAIDEVPKTALPKKRLLKKLQAHEIEGPLLIWIGT